MDPNWNPYGLDMAFASNGTSVTTTASELHSPSPPVRAPPGTIFMYTSTYALKYDQPVARGNLSDSSLVQWVAYQNARTVHRLVRRTVQLEFEMEDRYRLSLMSLLPPKPKRRRSSERECEWKPESVYKTFVDCKPDFFEKSNYQDHIPECSCFGKINMRIPKAWSRGPNKPKRQKAMHTLYQTDVLSFQTLDFLIDQSYPASLLQTTFDTSYHRNIHQLMQQNSQQILHDTVEKLQPDQIILQDIPLQQSLVHDDLDVQQNPDNSFDFMFGPFYQPQD